MTNQSMEQVPTISVVMSVYNGGKYVDAAVVSIRQQTFGDFEFIIIDDGSTDGTADILRRHAAADARLRIFTQSNQGLVAALNRGCGKARGEFIARMDADDVSLLDRFEKQIAYLRAHPEIGALGGAAQYIQDGRLIDMFLRPPARHQDILEVLQYANPVVHDAMMIRRAALESVGGYRQAFVAAEDLDLWLRLGERFELANLEDVVIHLTKHAEEVSFTKAAQQTLCALAAKHSAELRARTGSDPYDNVTSIRPAVLLELGVPAAAIEEVLVHGAPHRASVLLNHGETIKARRIIDDAEQFLLELPSPRQGRSRLALLRSKSYRLEHRLWPRLFWIARACVWDPRRIGEHLAALPQKVLGRKRPGLAPVVDADNILRNSRGKTTEAQLETTKGSP